MSLPISQAKNHAPLVVGHAITEKEVAQFKLMKYLYQCPKCQKPFFYGLVTEREGKSGLVYRYLKLYHHDRRKTSKRRYCYVPIRQELK